MPPPPPPRLINGEGPRLNYGTVMSTLALAGSVIYGVWAFNQSQIADLRTIIDQLRKDAMERDNRITAENARRETELRAVNDLQDRLAQDNYRQIEQHLRDLDLRREQFISVSAHKTYETRIDDAIKQLRDRMTTVENTRPTTGEFKAVVDTMRDRIEKLYGLYGQIIDAAHQSSRATRQ